MLAQIEFRNGKIRDYEVKVNYERRIVDIIEEREGGTDIVGFFPFETVTAVRFEKEQV